MPNMSVLSHICLVVFPSRTYPTTPCCISCLPALPHPRVPQRHVLAGAHGRCLPAALLLLFGGEPALQVSAQNKHSWLSYEPPEG